MGFRFVEKEVVFSFAEVLSFDTSDFAEVKITGYDCEYEVNGMTVREILRELALEYARALTDLSVPNDNGRVDSMVTWNDNEYVVKLAWIEEVIEDDVVE